MAEEEKRKKRSIAFEKKASEVSKDDIRVKLIGTIIEKDATTNSVVIDDKNLKVRVLLDETLFGASETGKTVRVIGIVAPALKGNDFEIKGEIIQDFSGLDFELYNKYLNLNKV